MARAANAATSRDGSAGGIDPDDAGRGEDDFKAVAQQLAAELGQAADQVDAVAALRHVGLEAALKIAVGKARKLFEECQAQTDFQAASEPKQAAREWDFEQKQDQGKGDTAAAKEAAANANHGAK